MTKHQSLLKALNEDGGPYGKYFRSLSEEEKYEIVREELENLSHYDDLMETREVLLAESQN